MGHTEDSTIEDHDRGLQFDLSNFGRRGMLKLFAGAGAAATLAACGSSKSSTATSSTGAADAATTTPASTTTTGSATTTASTAAAATDTTTTAAAVASSPIPEETAGPFPADGSNGPNLLDDSGVVRQDIRSSFVSSSTVAEGIRTEVSLTIVAPATGAPVAGAAVYLWHADRDGRYSIYDSEISEENYLRGVQEAGSDGTVTFTTIFPGCYDGRWPHMHFEVYADLASANSAGNIIATSQLALVESVCNEAYATAGYEQSASNLTRVSLAGDNVFRDDLGARETPATSGSVADGYTMRLAVPVQV